jgi:hypothetical protein
MHNPLAIIFRVKSVDKLEFAAAPVRFAHQEAKSGALGASVARASGTRRTAAQKALPPWLALLRSDPARSAHEIRTEHQSQDGESARPHRAA